MILLVENDLSDADLVLAALVKFNSAEGVTVVRSGEEAMDYLHRRGRFTTRLKNPAVIVMDLIMPGIGGLELAGKIRAEETLKLIPIVMFSSSRAESDVAECYQKGINAYVVKPLSFKEFMDVIKGLVTFWVVINEPPPNTERKSWVK